MHPTQSSNLNAYRSSPYIGPVYMTQGSGWSVSVCRQGYGLTFKGIAKSLEIKKIDATVLPYREDLRAAIHKVEKVGAFITDSSALSVPLSFSSEEEEEVKEKPGKQKLENHAVALFVVREEKRLKLFINDSRGSMYFFKDVAALSNASITQVFFSQVERQANDATTCHAYAVRDCKKFLQDPSAHTKQMLCLNGLENEQKEEIFGLKQIPSAFLMTPDKACRVAKCAMDAVVQHTS